MRNSFSRSIVIGVPPSVAFRYLADPTTAAVIDPAVISYEPDGGVIAAGGRNKMRLKMCGLSIRSVSETIVFEPDARMVFRAVNPSRPVRATATHTFDADPGGTSYTWAIEFEPTAVGGRIAAAIATRLFERNAIAQQQRLKSVLEQQRSR